MLSSSFVLALLTTLHVFLATYAFEGQATSFTSGSIDFTSKLSAPVNNSLPNISMEDIRKQLYQLESSTNASPRDERSAENSQDSTRMTPAEFERSLEHLVAKQWLKPIARYSLENSKTLEMAEHTLNGLEQKIKEKFENDVITMISKGWTELAARTALIHQYNNGIDKLFGMENALSENELKAISPTLKIIEDEVDTKAKPTESKKSTSSNNSPLKPRHSKVNTSDFIFEVTMSNFYEKVIRSKTPVIIDCYAPWCKPCQFLVPILEDVVAAFNGSVKIAKINCDKETQLAKILQIESYPTLFVIHRAQFLNSKIGVPQEAQLQDLVTSCLALPPLRLSAMSAFPKEKLDVILNDLLQATSDASLSMKVRETLNGKVDAILKTTYKDYDRKGDFKPKESIKTAIAYIESCARDIHDSKRNTLKTESMTFQEKILPYQEAQDLLKAAGFEYHSIDSFGKSTVLSDMPSFDEDNSAKIVMKLRHENIAILKLVAQRTRDFENKLRFNRISQSTSLPNSNRENIAMVPSVFETKEISKSSSNSEARPSKKPRKGLKTNSLFSVSYQKDKKHNEYFGGDSTVTQSVDDSK